MKSSRAYDNITQDNVDKFKYSMMTVQHKLVNLTVFWLILVICISDISADEDRQYRIGAEDVLDIHVWKEKELQREVIVRPDGGISFPFAGDVKAAGRTPLELQKIITMKVQKFIPDAMVTVSVTKLAGLRIYVIGKVKKSGQFIIGRYVDVLQALTLAGGLDPYASPKDIKVLRRQDGREVVFPFNYSAVKDGEKLKQNILLENDDVVVVP